MKLNLFLVFTICSIMVSMAQTKTVSEANSLSIAVTESNLAVVTQNETTENADKVKVYPTITEDIVYYGLVDENINFTITVYDVYGKKQDVEVYKGTIDINQLDAGIYIIQFSSKHYTVTKNVVRK
ncbi:T9SS type A sorting domain-containing protein [Winogradskyella eckloniae]|uniref:T9SS type A sorting domain-containing protein n=1 Tax=Winogradskyella eckloniae TaxID=1089306 RepID=UPI00156431B3|nr:T9SS type A sorting domain-containing protein [Winogradskyella eckloniae]NRD20579.1 T9SS type A sorting domain-containing protein [Winogradskyella eckloniae]